ncbi:MAG: TlpA family protein disulfide reductase [Geminicoccaceae bacterium]
MSARILTLVAFLACLWPMAQAHSFDVALEEPAPVAAFTFLDGDDNELTLAAFAGKIVVLNLWATWCAPCREEMPALDNLEAELGGDRFQVVALSVDRASADKAQAFLDDLGVEHLDLYRDPGSASARALEAPGLPTTVILDGEGREVARVLGIEAWDSDAAVAFFRSLIAKAGS